MRWAPPESPRCRVGRLALQRLLPEGELPVKRSVLVVGEAVADVVVRLDGGRDVHPGGSPLNVAYGLGRLGCDVTLLTHVGEDAYGAAIRGHLTQAGVRLVEGGDTTLATSSALALLDRDGAAQYTFEIDWALSQGEPRGLHAVHVHTGSIAAYLAPGADAVARILKRRRPTATISFDPNVRPQLLGDADSARRRAEAMVRAADVVKASVEDLAWLYPDVDPHDVAVRWCAAGPGLVVVTLGAEGSIAWSARDRIYVEPVHVRVVDTVGAGDAYMAALVDGLLTAGLLGEGGRERLRTAGRDELIPVLQRAARAAAYTVSRAGANPPSSAELSPLPSTRPRDARHVGALLSSFQRGTRRGRELTEGAEAASASE